MKVQILDFATGEEQVLGSFIIVDGKVVIEQDTDSVLEQLLEDPMITETGEGVEALDEPERWLSLLPENRCSPYFRARLLEPREAGGKGSGDFGHKGRPGEVGGSGPDLDEDDKDEDDDDLGDFEEEEE